ncbi:hypothetical protein [Lysobacter silvisoli]|uniref:Uncharacterized protein n=1 Tax=Lysobacter silvisoli TaxID=2293254 RepID=A0A371K351_9GAMM|nr:hypothetical protein [Lysobacter silvisoli]RDZ28333.1 hypothetical protein DX914_04120 [Lysobacter silvisoli]
MPYRVELHEPRPLGRPICSPATVECHPSLRAASEAARRDAVEHAKAYRVDVRVQIFGPCGRLTVGTQVRYSELMAPRAPLRLLPGDLTQVALPQ